MPATKAQHEHGAEEMYVLTMGAFSTIMNSSSWSTDFSSESAALPKSIFHTTVVIKLRIPSIRVSRLLDFSRRQPSSSTRRPMPTPASSSFRSSSSAVLTRCWQYWMNSENMNANALSPTSFLPRIGSGRSSAERLPLAADAM